MAPPAGKTEAPGVLLGDGGRTAPRLAGKVGHMQRPAAVPTAGAASLGRQPLVDACQKPEKGGIPQNIVVHFGGLLASQPETQPEGILAIKIPEGDSAQSITERDRRSPICPSKNLIVLSGYWQPSTCCLTLELSAPRASLLCWHFILHGRARAIC